MQRWRTGMLGHSSPHAPTLNPELRSISPPAPGEGVQHQQQDAIAVSFHSGRQGRQGGGRGGEGRQINPAGPSSAPPGAKSSASLPLLVHLSLLRLLRFLQLQRSQLQHPDRLGSAAATLSAAPRRIHPLPSHELCMTRSTRTCHTHMHALKGLNTRAKRVLPCFRASDWCSESLSAKSVLVLLRSDSRSCFVG